MTKAFLILFKIEFFRIWTRVRLITLGIMLLLGVALAFLINSTGIVETAPDSFFSSFSYSMILPNFFTLIVPVTAFFFSAGIISYDINNHWLSSILSRPVTKADFLIAKIFSVLTSLLIVMILTVLIPLIIFDLISTVSLKVEFLQTLYIIIAYLMEGLLFILIATFFSTFLSNFKNAFLLGLWILIDFTQKQIIPTVYWDNQFMLIFSDFFFPSSLSESAKKLVSTGKMNYELILWGISAITAFFSISLYNFSRINIDKSGE